jgi:hypothetical protein
VKLGRDKLSALEKKMRLKNRGRDKLKNPSYKLTRYNFKNRFMGVENDQKCPKMGHKKNRRFVIFSVAF